MVIVTPGFKDKFNMWVRIKSPTYHNPVYKNQCHNL